MPRVVKADYSKHQAEFRRGKVVYIDPDSQVALRPVGDSCEYQENIVTIQGSPLPLILLILSGEVIGWCYYRDPDHQFSGGIHRRQANGAA